PRRTLEGVVVNHETGLPLAKVQVLAVSKEGTQTPLVSNRVDAWTDDQGRFRLHPFPGESVGLLAYPAAGEPYLPGVPAVPWPDDNPRNVTVTLWPGVLLQGRVTEEGSGKPVAGGTGRVHPRTVGPPSLVRPPRSGDGI